jgi:DNA-binding transcriptional MerR regulator
MRGPLRIGELAKSSGVKVMTIRYYEDVGLLPRPARTAGNYRSYDAAAERRLRFIRRCRDLGFTVNQIRDLLRLSAETTMACAEVKRIASQHRKAIAAKLKSLHQVHQELQRLASSCRGDCTMTECRILALLTRPGRPRRRKT